jgi:hypothetical protein
MLARTFLMAKELRCSEIERQAAIEVLGMLERGELRFVQISRDWREVLDEPLVSNAFNISRWSHCMAGWMEEMKGRPLSQQCQARWEDLFAPDGFETIPEQYPPERCARALHAKLTTGKAIWD